ncbi:NAD(P)/FAD-dependent oxidoreductase [Salegentibacter sp. JZCK2]|uniref:NAD(P)/FAD-dependent oxidoreductase n=1 Tax=Salegentibacter tibetensis TaxID=2873600 RepID=UPI001CCD611C|nr:FAD/NAD(P)-binding oxidoreductase [Salegentibacter tibetensis]MBZ9728771.1 NAD(P)/FAD-dependent oxidoreductase [Salegentibacter tibetensis]
MKTILVLGAGTGGIVTARELSRFSGNEEDINLVKILVFEKEKTNVFWPSLPWVMVGKRKQEEITEKTNRLQASGLEVIKGEIETIDPENISVSIQGKQYKGDYMVVSLGVAQADVYNLDQFGHNFFTLKGAESFYSDIQKFDGGDIALLISSLPFKSPAAPYEAAMLIEDFVRKNNMANNTTVSLYTPEAGPMEFAGPEASQELRDLLEKKGIKYYPNHALTAVSGNKLEFSNGKNYSYNLLAYTPKHQLPHVIQKSPLAGKSGWVEVERKTLETAFKNVYAIGDITNITTETGTILPKIGVFARQQGAVVAHNIFRKMANQAPDLTFVPEGKYFIEAGEGMASETGGKFSNVGKNEVKMATPAQWGHFSKWWDEKFWFFKNF